MFPRILIFTAALWLAALPSARADDACLRDIQTLLAVQARNQEAVGSVLATHGEIPVPGSYTRVLARLVPHLGRRGPTWVLRGYRHSDLNAMSSLDGTVLLSSNLWAAGAPLNEDEVAAVLAHELIHVTREHGVQSDCLKRDHAGDPLGQELALGMQNQQHELEADREGQALMARAGFDVRGMRTLLERLARKGGPGGSYSHPGARERLAALAARKP